MAPAARWIARNGGSVILVLLGVSLLGASFFRSDDAPYALGLLIFGSSLVTAGVVLPRLRNAEVGPATGFSSRSTSSGRSPPNWPRRRRSRR